MDPALLTLLGHAPGSPLTLHKMSSVDLMYQATPTISLSLAEVEVRLQELGSRDHSGPMRGQYSGHVITLDQ